MSSHQAAEWLLVEDLTLREREILEQFADRKSDREIAEKLMLSLSTVKWYARQIYSKLGVDNRRMAVQRGQQLGLLGGLPSPVPHPELPTFLTPFVGREQEIQNICHLLAKGDYRLVTLAGLGGIGKTRLAVQIVHILAEQQPRTFADGICFVSLAGITAPAAIVTAVGSALGVSFRQGINPQRQLCDELSTKQMLLVLDNMEHLLDDKEFDTVGFVLALLHAAKGARIIVTSRARLGVQGEQLYSIEGLAYPENAVETLPELLQFSAVQLFLQHVERVQSNYQMQDADSHALGQICRLLEGMPLAIELAATWIRVMSYSEIVTELSRSLDLLSTTLHDLPSQYRSLRSVFERSWQLLSAEEREVLRQLSVFRGGFSREAAGSVTGMTLKMLLRFVDHSLVRRQASGRFDLHEYVRQFLGEKLYANSLEWEQTHHRHGAYYGAQFAKPEWLFGMLEKETFLQIASEIDNVQAAWQWAVQHQDAQLIRQLMNILVGYYSELGMPEEGGQVFDSAISALRSMNAVLQEERNSLEASLLLRRCLLMFRNQKQNPEALKLLNQSLRLLRQSASESDLDVALAFVQRGIQLGRSGQTAEAVESIKEGLAIFQAQNHVLGMAYALQAQGRVEAGWGRLGKAAESQAEALRLFEGKSSHHYWWVAHILAVTWLMQGRYQQAEAFFHRVIDHYATFHPPPVILAFVRRNLGDLAIAMGNFVAAEEYLAKAASHFAQLEMTWNLHIPLVANAGVMARLRGDLDEAERLLTQCLATARQVGFQQRIAINLHNLARLRHDQGRYSEEIALLDEALQIARQIDFRFATALVLCQLGHAATALKQSEVLGYYAEALQIATAEQIDRIAVEVLTGVAQQMIQKHNHDLAVALLSLVQNHTASEFETKRKAHGLLIELEAQLPAHQVVEGRQWGQALALQDMVSNLFNGYLFTSIERPNEPSPPPDKVPINLTDREVEVLRLVAQGNTDQQIAKRLQVSVRTVNSHITNILRKTGSNNRTAAAVFARDIRLV